MFFNDEVRKDICKISEARLIRDCVVFKADLLLSLVSMLKLIPKELDKLASSLESLSKKEKDDKSVKIDSLFFEEVDSLSVILLLLLTVVVLMLVLIFNEFDRDRAGVGSGGSEDELL
jgi:hypothetical protein